jgi:hypothetical protein
MDSTYFYLYLILVAISIVTFAILKCIYKINMFDPLIYKDPNDRSIISKITYYLSHIIFYGLFGILFGFSILPEMIIKTIIIEFILIGIKNCNIFDISDIESAILSIFVGIISYIMGALILVVFLQKK